MNTSSTEIWKSIPGFQFYEASSEGRIRSTTRVTSAGFAGEREMPGKIIWQNMLNSGYYRVCLSEHGSVTYHLVHVLVALTFLGPSPGEHGRGDNGNNYHVDHINGDKTDNRVSNLRWIRQWRNVGAKLTPAKVREIRHLHATGNYIHKELAQRYGVSRRCIGRVLSREIWKHV